MFFYMETIKLNINILGLNTKPKSTHKSRNLSIGEKSGIQLTTRIREIGPSEGTMETFCNIQIAEILVNENIASLWKFMQHTITNCGNF